MSERRDDVLRLFATRRLDEQEDYYRNRVATYRRARDRSRISAALLLVLAAVFGSLASLDIAGGRTAWAVAAAGLGALSAALTSYEAIYGFDRLSRDFERTLIALSRERLDMPGGPCRPDVTEESVREFVAGVEKVLLTEVDQWAKQVTMPDKEEN